MGVRLVLLLAGVVLVASCRTSPGDANGEARILNAEVRGESVTLTLDVCDAEDNRADVAVHNDEVVITVATDARPDAEGCAMSWTSSCRSPWQGARSSMGPRAIRSV